MSNVRIMGLVITEPLLSSRVMDRKPGVAVRDGVTLSASPPTELCEDVSTVDDAVCLLTDDKLSIALDCVVVSDVVPTPLVKFAEKGIVLG